MHQHIVANSYALVVIEGELGVIGSCQQPPTLRNLLTNLDASVPADYGKSHNEGSGCHGIGPERTSTQYHTSNFIARCFSTTWSREQTYALCVEKEVHHVEGTDDFNHTASGDQIKSVPPPARQSLGSPRPAGWFAGLRWLGTEKQQRRTHSQAALCGYMPLPGPRWRKERSQRRSKQRCTPKAANDITS